MFHVEQKFIIMNMMTISGKYVDVFTKEIFNAIITVENNIITDIQKSEVEYSNYIIPGFVDSHIHIESTTLTPSRFSNLVVSRGTIGVVTDPHEIANVLGVEGVKFMINDAKHALIQFFFGAPSCVPATSFETSGAILNSDDVYELLRMEEVFLLSEMMNYPGVIFNDEEVLKKIEYAKILNKPIDGHAPSVTGSDLIKYVNAGISTDHECSSLNEALEKVNLGMKIQIREGSAACNFNALYSLIDSHPEKVMLCTDDIHPSVVLNEGHIDRIIKMGLKKGLNVFNLLRAASVNPIQHYNLPLGLLRVGDSADFLIVDNLEDFNIQQSWIKGNVVYDVNNIIDSFLPELIIINKFRDDFVSIDDLNVKMPLDKNSVKVVEIIENEIITNQYNWTPKLDNDRNIISDLNDDVLKLVVVNRYSSEKPVVGFVKNSGFKNGAIASSVAHDSHNIIALGINDELIAKAINELIKAKGGLVSVDENSAHILTLPIAGLMSDKTGEEVAQIHDDVIKHVYSLGTNLESPFMTLSFLSLLVIPSLKLGDKGLFDVTKFDFVSLFD